VPCKALATAAERSTCAREMDMFCKEDHGQASFYNIETDGCLCREGYRYRTNAGCQPIHERGAGGITRPHAPVACTQPSPTANMRAISPTNAASFPHNLRSRLQAAILASIRAPATPPLGRLASVPSSHRSADALPPFSKISPAPGAPRVSPRGLGTCDRRRLAFRAWEVGSVAWAGAAERSR